MEYQVIARKYRPQLFSEVVGQEAIVTTLKNAIRMNRTAHAYLFSGCRGTGKTTLARLLAKGLNCFNVGSEQEPCNQCSSCKEIASGRSVDVIEIDGASHRGIEDIRQINETIGFIPATARFKIYLIDEVHMLTKEAFNALLKTLEEPPPHVKFFFATTEPHKIPLTILSRCQHFTLRRLKDEEIQNKLGAILVDLKIAYEEEALAIIARRAEGSLRDAQSLLDQAIAYETSLLTVRTISEILSLSPQTLFFALDEAGGQGEIFRALEIAALVFSSGKNLAHFLEELTLHFRTHLLVKCGGKVAVYQDEYAKKGHYYREEQLVHLLEYVGEAIATLKETPSERTYLEIVLLHILQSHKHLSLESLVHRLLELEKRVKEVPEEKPKLSPQVQAPTNTQVKEQRHESSYDTLMYFAAKELNGSLKKG